MGRLWWARLCHGSPRYEIWREILGSDDVPLLAPSSVEAILGETPERVYLLDWQNLDGEASDRLLNFLTTKLGTAKEEIEADLNRDGHFPIREADVNVFFDARAFL